MQGMPPRRPEIVAAVFVSAASAMHISYRSLSSLHSRDSGFGSSYSGSGGGGTFPPSLRGAGTPVLKALLLLLLLLPPPPRTLGGCEGPATPAAGMPGSAAGAPPMRPRDFANAAVDGAVTPSGKTEPPNPTSGFPGWAAPAAPAASVAAAGAAGAAGAAVTAVPAVPAGVAVSAVGPGGAPAAGDPDGVELELPIAHCCPKLQGDDATNGDEMGRRVQSVVGL